MLEQLSSSSCLANVDSQSGGLFLLLLNYLFASQCSLKNSNKYPPDRGSEINDGDHFDFIVVGAGSAGSVVTNILVNDKKWSVLLLEAGGYPSITTEIPLLFFNIQKTDEIWSYQTEPSNTSCIGLKNGACHWPRGRLLGGCSSINGMTYIRGNRDNYDSWAKAGNTGWDYENVMEAFKENENLRVKNLKSSFEYGKDGLLPLTNYKADHPVRDLIFESVRELGYPVVDSETPIGYLETLQTIEKGTRANTAKHFLGPVGHLNNLKLVTNAYVEKIIIEDGTKSAKGVTVKLRDQTLDLFADKEIIISAGAINSPQILLLSGLGPKKQLQQNGIQVIKDLMVGHNLQDHLSYWLFASLSDDAIKPDVLEDEIYEYFSKRQGKFSSIGLANINGFLNTNNNTKYPNIQNIQVAIRKNDKHTLDMLMELINMNEIVQKNLRDVNSRHHILITVVVLLKPESRGRVMLKDKDPVQEPIIESGYLTDAKGEDLETLVKAIRIVEAQMKTKALQKLNAEVLDIGIPNCKGFEFKSDDYWRCAVKNLGTTAYHPVGTCKMGPVTDPAAVVDPELKVHGIKNLRVADASIMPTITSGNTNGPSMMIGRRVGQMILKEHSL